MNGGVAVLIEAGTSVITEVASIGSMDSTIVGIKLR